MNASYAYTDSFSFYGNGEHPCDLLVERHTDRPHLHGRVEDGAYHILCRGNKHLLLTPPLRDFSLVFQCRGDAGAPAAGCYVFFRYDSRRQAGYYIKRQWSGAGGATVLGVCDAAGDRALASASDPAQYPVAEWTEIRLEVRGDIFRVLHNGSPVARFRDRNPRLPGAGQVGFDRDRPSENGARGPFWLRRIRLTSSRAPAPSVLWKPLRIKFPAEHNGIVSPFFYELEAAAYANHVQITARLTGGPAERDDPVLLRGRAPGAMRWQNERLLNPYLRLERPGGGDLGAHYLFRGSVGLKEHWDRRATGLPPSDIECPLERIVRLPALPPRVNVFVGYEYYEAEERNWMKGGPTEAWIDPMRGRIIAAGAPLKANDVLLEIGSPPDKMICRMIPARTRRKAAAMAFARANHYFMENERARFHIAARHRRPECRARDLRVEWTLEDVFRQPLQPAVARSLRPAPDPAARRWRRDLGAAALTGPAWSPGRLPPGVYHVAARLCEGQRVMAEVRRAFEVLPRNPRSPAPPLISGLPELLFYESSDFVSAADVFDPWMGRAVDEGHYVSHNGFPLPFAEKNRTWNLVHLYRRQWWLRLSQPGGELENHARLIRHADLLYPGALLRRMDLWHPTTYRRPADGQSGESVFDALLQFLQSPAFAARGSRRLQYDDIRAAGEITNDQFVELFEKHWKSWLEFFNRWYAEVYMPRAHARLQALGFQGRWGWFGPYPPYGSVYKSAWFAHYMGRDLRSGWTRHLNGPLRFESYSRVCGYPHQRDVFQLAAMKLETPDLRLYPEVYGLTGIPADFHVLLGSPPNAQNLPPALSFRKCFFEYAYAAAWFGRNGFEFWDDNGFQPKHWDRDHFAEFLSAWSVIRRVRPKKPLRTAAFVYSRQACRAHADTLERYPQRYYQYGKGPVFFGDIYNTAEECCAYAYEQARLDGQCAGFLASFEMLNRLSPADVHTLVLPPLLGLSDADRATIRRAHARGIALVAFESVPGLEDLFGVVPLKTPVVLRGIRTARAMARQAPWRELAGASEALDHQLCRAAYRCRGAQAVLEGLDGRGRVRAPALAIHRTRWGRTALWTIPPTVIRREAGDAVFSYGKASLSRLANRAMALAMRYAGASPAETTAGKLIGFRDAKGLARIVIEEDSHPEEGGGIQPEITIRLPRVSPERIQCDRAFEVTSARPGCARLRLDLRRDDCAMITVDDRA